MEIERRESNEKNNKESKRDIFYVKKHVFFLLETLTLSPRTEPYLSQSCQHE